MMQELVVKNGAGLSGRPRALDQGKAHVLILVALTLVVAIVVDRVAGIPGVDWREVYRPASRMLASGESPYQPLPNEAQGFYFFNPPWALVPLIPLALLPESLGRVAFFAISLLSVLLLARRFGARGPSLALLVVSLPVLGTLLNMQIDWLALLGVLLPPQLGLFFVTMKPQVGGGIAVFWLVEAWRRGGAREVARVFAPITLLFAASLWWLGPWPLGAERAITEVPHMNLWPWALPVGLVLLTSALRKRRVEEALMAAPFLSPYVLFHSWIGALLGLASRPFELAAAVIGLWAAYLLRGVVL